MFAIIRKQFLDMQGRLLTYPIFALAVSVLSVNPGSTYVLMGIACLILVMDLVSQTAGDDITHGTFEFIFTRAIDRRSYVAAKFFFCLPLLIGFILLCFLFEAINVRERFFTLVTQVGDLNLAARSIDLRLWAFAATGAVLFFCVSFFGTIRSGPGASFPAIAFLALVATGIYAVAVTMLLTQWLELNTDSFGESLQNTKFAACAFAALAIPAFFAFVGARENYARRTLPLLAGSRGARTSSKGWLGLLILLIVLVLIAAYVFLASHQPVGPQP